MFNAHFFVINYCVAGRFAARQASWATRVSRTSTAQSRSKTVGASTTRQTAAAAQRWRRAVAPVAIFFDRLASCSAATVSEFPLLRLDRYCTAELNSTVVQQGE